MKWMFSLLLLLFVLLQYKLWVGEGSLVEVAQFRSAITVQRTENHQLRQRNEILQAEVRDLKQGLAAVEERARAELGMVKPGEEFYQIVDNRRQ